MPVLLMKEKVSKLSESITFANSFFMVIKRTSQEGTNEMTKVLSTRTVNLKSQMDHASLAEQAVGLNLKLMKWR